MEAHQAQNIYQKIKIFADRTQSAFAHGNTWQVLKHLTIAEQQFIKGTPAVRNAIANVYLYSLSNFAELHRLNVFQILPPHLKAEYLKQLNTSGI